MMDTGTFIPGGYPLIVLILMCIVEMFTSNKEMIDTDKTNMEKVKYDRKIMKEKSRSRREWVETEVLENKVNGKH